MPEGLSLDKTAVWYATSRMNRLAWVPIPLFLTAIVALKAAGVRTVYEFPFLLLTMNLLFSTLIALFIAYLISRSFLMRGTPGLLLLGCGVLFWGASGFSGASAGLLAGPGSNFANATATIHNICIWLSALCQLSGAILLMRPGRSMHASGLWMALATVAVLGTVGMVVLATLSGLTPTFFVQGHGGTTLRQIVLFSAVIMFALTAVLLRTKGQTSVSQFTFWYALGLGLTAVGLFGVMIEASLGSLVSWSGRASQYLGGVYMLVAALASVYESRVWGIPLEDALRETEERFKILAESTFEGVAISAAGRFLDVNDQFAKMVGYSRNELIGMDVGALVLPEDRERVIKGILSGSESHIEHRVVCRDGTVLTVEAHGRNTTYRERPVRITAVRNITEQIKSQEILREKNLFLKEAQVIARMGGWKANPQTDYLEWTEGVYDIIEAPLDYKPGLSEGITFFVPESIPTIIESLTSCLATGKPFTLECQVTTMKGLKLWTEVRGLAPVVEGARSYVVGTFQDITERKKVEERLRQTYELLEAVTRGTAVIIATVDTDLCFTYFNQAYQAEIKQLTGRDIHLGQSMVELFAHMPEQQRIVVDAWTRILAGEHVNKMIEFGDPGCYRRVYNALQTPIQDATGKVVGAGEVAYDVTRQMQMEEDLRQSEERFKAIASSTPDHILLMDRDLRYILVINPQLGLTEQDMIGKTDHDLFVPEDAERLTQIKRQVLASGLPMQVEIPMLSRNGEQEFFEGAYIPKFDPEGRVDGLIGYFKNISARKQSESMIIRQNLVLQGIRRIFEEAIRWEGEGDIGRTCLEVVEYITGSTMSFIGEIGPDELFHDIAISSPSWEPCSLRDKTGHRRSKENIAIQGLYGSVLVEGRSIMTNTPGTHPYSTGLPEGHPPLKNFLGVPLIIGDKTIGMIAVANREGGYSDEDRKNLESLAPAIHEALLRTRAEEELRRYRQHLEELIHARTQELVERNLRLEQEMSERRHAEGSLRRASVYNRSLIEASPDPLVTIDANGRITDVNKAVEKVTGQTRIELIGTDFSEYFTQPDQARAVYKQVFSMGSVHDYPLEIRHSDGHITPVLYNASVYHDEKGVVLGVFAAARDITALKRAEEEKKNLEDQLIQSQKMEAIGRFAGGIAHDLNNMLYPIIIDIESLMEDSVLDPIMHQTLSQVLKAANRQKDLIRQILAFSRRTDQPLGPLKVAPLIRETLDLLRSTLPSTIEIKQHIDAASDIILGNPTQIQQIIMNLFRNAADAIGTQRGTIEISLANTYLEPGQAHPELQAGGYLTLSVNDSGHGIPSEIMNNIFDPFFTTKEVGKGSGMGLSVVHGILRTHGGAVTVESEPAQGTRFTIYLPLTDKDLISQNQSTDSVLTAKDKVKVLLVDDEEIILSSVRHALTRIGYEVVAIQDGLEALSLFRTEPDRFDLVMTDLTMPHLTGVELAGKLMDIRPNIPVILCTGFNEVMQIDEARKMGIRELLLKPASTHEIKTAITRALEV